MTQTMLNVLEEIYEGMGTHWLLKGSRAWQGRDRTLRSMRELGLIDAGGVITLRGRDALEKAHLRKRTRGER